ncbi:phosphoadenosine phosphosulfate reductase family protein [Methylobacterium sp. CCH5-D2]|uniref:phosphoadenosine phosphosulfate reductase domain-containing protein n=1 Tax=Methylobacterium sp. CCH5-D2 TaxID=1768765 RepID=UPI000832A38A|nr:phosphoadenosine phosphosulfate reductase family protein [Methylobacterium sp. CCH5-D2]
MSSPYLITGPALISFSGGRTSGFMLWNILQAHGGTLPADVHVAFANTGREIPETLDFVQECSERWGVRIVWLEFDAEAGHRTRIVDHNSACRDGEPLAAVLATRKMLANPVMRFCTIDSKIKRLQAYAREIAGWSTWSDVKGLRFDEPSRVEKQHRRHESGKDGKSFGVPVMPLYDARVTKRDVSAFWARQPFDLRLQNVGGKTPLGNCDLCFLKGQSTILGILRERPELAEWWIAQERRFESTKRPGDFAYFRKDRPSYAEMLRLSQDQGDLLTLSEEEESLDCACTD